MPADRVRMLLTIAAVVLSAPLVAQRRGPPAPSVDLIEIDVVAIDERGNAVGNLEAGEFRVKEDGQAVEVKTFSKVVVGGDQSRDGRTIALLLDDTTIPAIGTVSIQTIARAFLPPAQRRDELSVVRLHSRSDEAYGDIPEALHRIAEYRGGVMPYVPRESQADVLRQIAAMSRQLLPLGNRRKAIVCIGAQILCDVSEPMDTGDLSNGWLAAVSTAAQANVAVYALVPGRLRFRGGGIVEATGGETFSGMSDFRPPIARVWNDSSLHYLVGYWPGQKSRRLHTVAVSVSRPHVQVLARRQRGDAPS